MGDIDRGPTGSLPPPRDFVGPIFSTSMISRLFIFSRLKKKVNPSIIYSGFKFHAISLFKKWGRLALNYHCRTRQARSQEVCFGGQIFLGGAKFYKHVRKKEICSKHM